MDVTDNQGLLIVNLENCISNTASEQVVKGVYTVVTSNACSDEDETVLQLPLAVHCSEEQQAFSVSHLHQEHLSSQHYNEVNAQHFHQITLQGDQILNDREEETNQEEINVNSDESSCITSNLGQGQSDNDAAYYAEIYNYLTSQIIPERATENYKKNLKKKSYNYRVIDGELYYGQKASKRVITERPQQMEILKNVHIEKDTGVHLGLKKMYVAINRSYFWKGLYVDVANFVRQCKQCSETAETTIDTGQSLQSGQEKTAEEKTEVCGNGCKVWQKVELKVYGPYPKTVSQNEFIITIADPFSHWIVAHPVSDDDDDLANHVVDLIFKTFCTFGFAKCCVVGVSEEVLDSIQNKYQAYLSSLRDTFVTCFLTVSQLMTCGPSFDTSLVLLQESLSQCTWVGKLLDEFVSANPTGWDTELQRFIFEYCVTVGSDLTSPFRVMYGRNPVNFLEEDKENFIVEKEKPPEILSKRRRLQSSILQCRHCEEVFTSKISFRIHQRKHTEEARRQGTLEGQEPLVPVPERERRLLRRSVLKRRQRLLNRGNLDRRERLMTLASRKLHLNHEALPKDKRRAELQANTVAAVRKLLASTKEERRRRGRYHKYSAELQEEMARYAVEHGNLETVRYFSKRIGTTVSESTVRNIVKLYQSYTPGLKEEIGRYAARFGVDSACTHFTELLRHEVRLGLVRKFKKLFLSHHPDLEGKQVNSNKNKGTSSAVAITKQKNTYTSELKDEIGSYASHFGISVAVKHFAQKLPFPPKESMVRRFRKLYLDKHRATPQVAMLQQQLQLANNVQETVGPSSSQTIDILQASLNILNNTQINGPTAVVYNTPFQSSTLPHIQSTNQLISATHTTNSVPLTFHPVSSGATAVSTNLTYQQTPVTASVIMNQNPVSFNQNSVPLQTFQQSPPIYSSYNNQEHTNSTSVPVSHKSVVTSLPLTITQTHSQIPQQTTSQASAPHSAISTITVEITPQQEFQHLSNHSTVVVPHQSHANNQQNLDSQQPILVSHEHNGTTVVQQLVASSLQQTHLQQHEQQSQHTQSELQQSLSHEIIASDLNNAASEHQTLVPSHSQVLVQQSSVIADSLLVEQQTVLPDHSQIVEHHNLESATFVHALNDGSTSLPFDTTGSTLIADRDGTYSLATTINNEISVTVEKESGLETQEIPITIQTQETQTSQETDDVVISIVPQEVTDGLRIEHVNEVPEKLTPPTKRVRHKAPEAKVIHVVKLDCSMEEDADDPLVVEDRPIKRKGKGGNKKKSSAVGQKRGNYTVYSPEIRAEMGKYAAEHGSQRACQHFKAILGHDVPESTIRGLRDKYLLKREHCGSSSVGDKEVTSLGYAPRGRPMRLGKYDEVVQECIRELIKSGEKVSSFLAIATAKQVLMQYEPGLLEENGGKVKLNVTWAKSFLKRIGVQNNS